MTTIGGITVAINGMVINDVDNTVSHIDRRRSCGLVPSTVQSPRRHVELAPVQVNGAAGQIVIRHAEAPISLGAILAVAREIYDRAVLDIKRADAAVGGDPEFATE